MREFADIERELHLTKFTDSQKQFVIADLKPTRAELERWQALTA